MRFALDRYGSRGHFFFENQSFIDFQIGNVPRSRVRASEMIDSQIGNENRNLFPIPASQIILNPNLTQNPGY